MTPMQLIPVLHTLFTQPKARPVMLWGAPGIGKSSIVAQVGKSLKLPVIDLRLSQLAPTDLRGLPVPNFKSGLSHWLPPTFLPRDGVGILFLDEINQAPPVMQAMAQQLILDRRCGEYELPNGWRIVAAGNRNNDMAAVYDMPAPLANRMLHFELAADPASFFEHAASQHFSERVIAFLHFRPNLLHQINTEHAFPSPRSWQMASELLELGLKIDSAVGVAACAEFEVFEQVYNQLPNIDAILAGKGAREKFPSDEQPAARYATVIAIALRSDDDKKAEHGLTWLQSVAHAEFLQLGLIQTSLTLKRHGKAAAFYSLSAQKPGLQKLVEAIHHAKAAAA